MTALPGLKRCALLAAVLLLWGGLGLLLSACSRSTPPPRPPEGPASATSLPGSAAGPMPTPGAPSALQPTSVAAEATSPLTLTLWTTESFSPTQVITAGQVLARLVAAFEQDRPDVRLRFVLKKPYGKAGILDYLLTTEAVVPDLLPDLAFIDVDELDDAARAGLIQPLDELLPPDLVADLYPFAREACTFDGQLYGLQVRADLDHLVYNSGRLAIPPATWSGVLSSPGRYLFPAGGQNGLVNDAFLVQYLAVRSQITEAVVPSPFLDEDSLVAVLQYYRDGASRGIFPPAVLGHHSSDDCWRDYLLGQAVMTEVSAHRYLVDRGRAPASAPASIPSISGPAAALSRGWALALVAREPARQSAAVQFMMDCMQPEVNGAWNGASGTLPTRRSALTHWQQADDYTRFMEQQLSTAQSRPRMDNDTRVAAALQQAVEAVLGGRLTPEEAAAQAISGQP